MILQNIYLDVWDWYLRVFYDVDDLNEAISELESVGCSEDLIYCVKEKLKCRNTGFTYSDIKHRFSIIIISKTSGSSEFYNTLDHEKLHVLLHISEACNINLDSEEFEYLSGEITERLYPVSKQFICN